MAGETEQSAAPGEVGQSEKVKSKLRCSYCGHETRSEGAMKLHIGSKHYAHVLRMPAMCHNWTWSLE